MKRIDGERVSALKLALQARRQRDTGASEALASEPIAVIGMACRFPGGANSPALFWELLRAGRDAVGEIPASRWDPGLHSPDPAAPGKIGTRHAAILEDVDLFDPVSFGISPREAQHMDPQQRLLLETTWEALTDAGLPVESLSGSRTGVFAAVFNSDYARMTLGRAESITQHTMSGGARSVAAGRISFLLDLRGPSVTVDTACSSSLVAVHMACQSLRAGESAMAIVGGVSLRLQPQEVVALTKLGMLAPDGRCKPFDASADGFGFGEGCGVVVLKRLADALAANDPIHAVIRGTAINQDGRSNALTAPNGLAQQALIRDALANARLRPEDVTYIEAHGTGTKLGDPIEIEALAETVGQPAPGGGPCLVGSVKSNIGHLEAAAGIAGLIKTVLAMRHGEIPATLHFRQLNPHISLEGTRLSIASRHVEWPRNQGPRVAGVSSFGFSGTNAHVILEEAPDVPRTPSNGDRPELITLSAGDPQSLAQYAERMASALQGAQGADLADIAYTSSARRGHHDRRAAVLAGSVAEAVEALRALGKGGEHRALIREAGGVARGSGPVFVFSGQGAQWPRMGMGLLRDEVVFRTAIEECDALIHKHAGWSLLGILSDEPPARLDETEYAQPAIFAVQIALARLWQSWGVEPRAVVGHSAGEVAAACVAGVLELEEAVRVITLRGRVMQAATGNGCMVQVTMAAADAADLIRPWGDDLCVAAINGPTCCVLSGGKAAMAAVLGELGRMHVSARALPVRYAFHSPQMEDLARQLVRELGVVKTSAARVPAYSTVTGRLAGAGDFDGAYWGRNVREAVRFQPAIEAIEAAGLKTFVEVAPHAVLSVSLAECAEGALVVPSMRRAADERRTMLHALGVLHVNGHGVNWSGVHGRGRRCVSLPAPPWKRERVWVDDVAPRTTGRELTPPVPSGFELRELRVASAPGRVAEVVLHPGLPFVRDHQIHGVMLVPMAAFVTLLSRFAGDASVSDVALEEALRVDDGAEVVVQVSETAGELVVHSWSGDRWTRHVTARRTSTASTEHPVRASAEDSLQPVAIDQFYDEFARCGAEFGPAMRCIREVELGKTSARAVVCMGGETGSMADLPRLLDAGLQVLGFAFSNARDVHLPVGMDRVEIRSAFPVEVEVHARLHAERDGGAVRTGDLVFRDLRSGELLAALSGCRFRRATSDALGAALDRRLIEEACLEQRWREAGEPEGGAETAGWLVLADQGGIGEAFAAQLAARGCPVRVMRDAAALAGAQPRPGENIAHLWSLDAPSDPGAPGFEAAQSRLFDSLVQLVRHMSGLEAPGRLHLVTRGALATEEDREACHAGGTMLWGALRTLALEHPDLAGRRVDLDPGADTNVAAGQLARELVHASDEPEVAYRHGHRRVRRLVRRERDVFEREGWRIRLRERGLIENLEVVPTPVASPGPGEVRVRVHAAGLNFRDVLLALGMYPAGEEIPLGAECAGIVEAVGAGVTAVRVGDAVICLAADAFARAVIVPANRVARAPRGIDLADAATVPVTFLTALYGLCRVAELKPGETVLIHAAAGGVGLAAVQIAQTAGATVIASVGSAAKAAHLRSMGVDRIVSSRTTDFAGKIREWTEGRGVDVVLNSLSDEFIPETVSCLARNGRFVELGKKGIWSVERMRRERPDVRYRVIDLIRDAGPEPGMIEGMFEEVVSAIESGRWRPLPRTEFPMRRAADAFRYMAQARHLGKIVLRAPDRALSLRGDGAYVVTGGLGALGLEVAEMLAGHGARRIVLLGRRPPGEQAQARIARIAASGARVAAVSVDISDFDALRDALESIERDHGALAGVVHAAGVLDDGMLLKQTAERFDRVWRSKARGAWNLHRATLGRRLDFFVMFSSVAGVFGAAGQSAYAGANAFLEMLARLRRAQDLPAQVVHWGVWAEAGMAARTQEAGARLGLKGLVPMAPGECLRALRYAMTAGLDDVVIARADWDALGRHAGEAVVEDLAGGASSRPAEALESRAAAANLTDKLRSTPGAQRPARLTDHLRQQTLRVLGLPPDFDLDPDRPLIALGLDSLMAVELGNLLSADLGRRLPVTVIFENPTLRRLTEHLLGLLDLGGGPGADRPGEAVPVDIDQLSESEAEALLAAELETK